jgi:hypothetical protein
MRVVVRLVILHWLKRIGGRMRSLCANFSRKQETWTTNRRRAFPCNSIADCSHFQEWAARAAAFGPWGERTQESGPVGTAMQCAAIGRSGQIITLLLDNGADVNQQCGCYGTALGAAVEFGHLEIVKL